MTSGVRIVRTLEERARSIAYGVKLADAGGGRVAMYSYNQQLCPSDAGAGHAGGYQKEVPVSSWERGIGHSFSCIKALYV